MLYKIKLNKNIVNKLSIGKYEHNKKFILVRHGESIWNKDSKFTGWSNIPLIIKGETEAMLIGKTLIKNNIFPDIIFTSVLDRCIDTSNIINLNPPKPLTCVRF